MGELKLNGLMAITKDFKTGEEYDYLRDFLLTDPLKITHYINFWRQELPNATVERKVEIEAIIVSLLKLAENQAKLTCNAFAFESKEVTVNEIETIVETIGTGDPSKDNLKLVALNGEDVVEESTETKALRVKYADHIKKHNIDGLRAELAKLNAEGNNADAEELVKFILGEGLYQGKRVKKWTEKNINSFLEGTKPKVVSTKVSEVIAEDNPAEVDLHKRFDKYLGENKMSVNGLRAECKYLLSNNEVDRALALTTFILAEGEYVADEGKEPIKWVTARIEEFVKSIRDDLEAHPIELKPAGFTDIAPELKGTADVVGEPKPEWDVKMTELYATIKSKVFSGETEDNVRAWVFETVKTKKVENLDMYHNKDNTPEELNSMYATFCIAFVSEAFKEKAIKELDVKAEIVKMVKDAVDNKEQALSKVIQEAHKLYVKRGEKVNLAETKEIVYSVTEETQPEFYKQLLERTGEQSKEKKVEVKTEVPVIVQDTSNFEKDHPETWEEVKGAKTLKDVYDMAREQEKKQSFLIVSEMITHLILSGKINDTETGLPVKWDKAQIELWINNMFKNEETVAEAVASTKIEGVIPSKEEPVKLGEDVVTPPINVENVNGKADSSGTPVELTEVSNETVSNTDIIQDEIQCPNGVVIPDEDKEFKELYAHKKQGLWQGVANLINKWQTAGKSKKDITHDLVDKLKALARNDDLKQCYTRNWHRTNLNELQNIVQKIASQMGVEDWVLAE